MRDIFKIFSIFTPKQLREFYFIFSIMLLGAFFESIGIGAILPLVSMIEDENFYYNNIFVKNIIESCSLSSREEIIIAFAGVLIFCYVGKNIFVAWEMRLQRKFICKYQRWFSVSLLERYLYKPYTFHVQNNTALLLRNVNSGGFVIFNQMLMSFFIVLTELITALAIWLLLLFTDWVIAVGLIGIIAVLIGLVLNYYKSIMHEQGVREKNASAEYLKWINQGLGAIKETKILQKEQFFLERFDNSYAKYAEAIQKFYFFNEMPRLFIESFVVCGVLFLIMYKVIIGEDTAVTMSVFGMLALAAFRMLPSINRIIGYTNVIKNQMPFFLDIYPDLIELKMNKLKTSKTGEEKPLAFNRDIMIDKLSFSYVEGNEIIKNATVVIPKGKFVGVVGASGAGKTTFVDILLGLLEPTSGKILCDGVDTVERIEAWRNKMAYVPQDIYLIDGTVRENIALGVMNEDIDDTRIKKVIEMAELDGVIKQLPNGLDSFVGERGVRLSGGQRQRIGIARALYQEPAILILDEATSALDKNTEDNITKTLTKLKGKLTIIAIAHRISTLEECDFKIEIKNGNIIVV